MVKKPLIFVSSVLILFALCIGPSEEVREVSCALGTNCFLPCVFKAGAHTSIHWRKSPGEVRVHSYYHEQNQDQHQDQAYRDRTALFEEKVHRGDATLLLSEVKVQDEGEYVCFTSTTSDSRVSKINLSVFVKIDEVDLVRQGSELVCRAEGLYPVPEVHWSSGFWFFGVKTTVHLREDQLYDITSSITPWPNPGSPDPRSTYPRTLCTVSTVRSSRTVVLSKEYHLGAYYNDAVLRCLNLKVLKIMSVVWKFNQTQTILTRSGSDLVYNESWRQFVDGLTQSNCLVLKDLTKDQEGLYSCHVITDTVTHVITMQLEIEVAKKNKEMIEFTVCCSFLLLIGAFFCGYFKGLYNLDSETIQQRIRDFFSGSVQRDRAMNISMSLQESWGDQNDYVTLPNPTSVTDNNAEEPSKNIPAGVYPGAENRGKMTPTRLRDHRRTEKKKR